MQRMSLGLIKTIFDSECNKYDPFMRHEAYTSGESNSKLIKLISGIDCLNEEIHKQVHHLGVMLRLRHSAPSIRFLLKENVFCCVCRLVNDNHENDGDERYRAHQR